MRIEIRPPSGLVPLLMTLPLVHALRHGYPDADLALAAAPEFQPLLLLTGTAVRRAARRGRPRHDAVRLDLEALGGVRSRSVAGFGGRPLWRAFLAAAMDAGLRCRAMPRPPYLQCREPVSAPGPRPVAHSGPQSVALAVGPGKGGPALRGLAQWLQRRGEMIQEIALEPVTTPGAVGLTVQQLAGRRLVLSDSPEVSFLAAALGVPVLSLLTARQAAPSVQPFLGSHTLLRLPRNGGPLPLATLRDAAEKLL